MEKLGLVLRHLQLMRGSMKVLERKLDELTNDMVDVKERMGNLENSISLSRTHTDERLTAIERALEMRL